MKHDFDFRVVQKGNFAPENEWTPPFIYVDNGMGDERSDIASMITERFNESGADFKGIDNAIDAYEGEYDKNPLGACNDSTLTPAEQNGAKALAITFCSDANNIEGRKIAEDFIRKVYSLDPINTNDTVSEFR